MRQKQKGFTLIEILVVMVIISIVTGVAMLTLTSHSGKQVDSVAKQLSGLIRSAHEQALLQSMVIGVLIQKNSYEFLQATGQNEKGKLIWTPINDELLTHYDLPNRFELTLSNDQHDDRKNETLSPQIVISINGDITPFVLYVGKSGMQPHTIIKGEPDGYITQQTLS